MDFINPVEALEGGLVEEVGAHYDVTVVLSHAGNPNLLLGRVPPTAMVKRLSSLVGIPLGSYSPKTVRHFRVMTVRSTT